MYDGFKSNNSSYTKKELMAMFGKLTKTDVFYLVTFALTLGFLYFSMITSA
ncbi:hypothetical protein GCM10011409_05480 [Lentibacillus populi]|uniref:Uncharacterized protein n=1 Tax=Lentibacillus populi TaxID=1827502 RepID=A0A9W5TUH4_9BACI|nr:hypothetical protein GCM10011409_05480 [Lentibacillus populi]